MTSIEKLELEVQRLHNAGAYHKRRGFSLADSTKIMCSNHILEECTELQAEACITENREAIVEEAGDVIATYLHLLCLCGISLEEVADKCLEKLDIDFTTDINEICTSDPGFTRRNRE